MAGSKREKAKPADKRAASRRQAKDRGITLDESRSVTIHRAKTHLSQLIALVRTGAEVLIKRGSEPVARLVPVDGVAARREFGALRGKVAVGPEFFEPLADDELAAWER